MANGNEQPNGSGGKLIHALAIGAAAFVEQAVSEQLIGTARKLREYHQKRKALKLAPDPTTKGAENRLHHDE